MAAKSETIGKVLFTQEDITKRAKEICKQIDKDYEGEEVLLLGTLKGSIMWMVEIMKHLSVDTNIDFITASSYGSSTISSGVVKITYEPASNMYNKNVIILEDIVDTGNTLKYLIEKLQERGPKSIKVCSMLNKQARRTTDFQADYIGFEIDDLFVIGYGLDYDQKFRNLPYISYLDADDVVQL
ncbi:MAG: hypoxanthine phosphoribosyltransferase [Clostridiales bacterium]|nr:hypoxanthine phosphoribosyltransferase [Candidatus Crickella caballi]